jgi:uncharacterized membrane protein YhaH (DUF805 family)
MGPSWLQILILGLFFIAFIFPIFRILKRIGFSGWWAVLVIVPLVPLVGLWVLAFIKWPGDNETQVIEQGQGIGLRS